MPLGNVGAPPHRPLHQAHSHTLWWVFLLPVPLQLSRQLTKQARAALDPTSCLYPRSLGLSPPPVPALWLEGEAGAGQGAPHSPPNSSQGERPG